MPATILIADDYDDTRELLRVILESNGYQVREAQNGRDCLELARREAPSLILLDISMPSLDGWSVLRELRADERTRRIPCIAVTAFAMERDRQRALAAGFDDYVAKPFRAKELLEKIERALDRQPRDGMLP